MLSRKENSSENLNEVYYNDSDNQDLLRTALLVVDHVDAMLAYWDKDCICHFANHAYKEWFGKSRDEIVGFHIKELLGQELYSMNLPFITEVLKGNLQAFEREIPLPNGGTRHSLATYTPHIVNGQVKGFFVLVADSTLLKNLEQELKEEKEKVEKMATHDFLTGLPNRVLLDGSILCSIENSKKSNGLFALMTMDVDQFKEINDNYGHDVGDLLLKEIASKLKKVLRYSDIVFRIGGDEFLLLFTSITSALEAETLATRIISIIDQPFEIKNNQIHVTASVGVAIYPTNGTTVDDLIKASDNALYKAKRLGRNRYELT